MKNWSFVLGMLGFIFGFGLDNVWLVGIGLFLTLNAFFPILVNPIKI